MGTTLRLQDLYQNLNLLSWEEALPLWRRIDGTLNLPRGDSWLVWSAASSGSLSSGSSSASPGSRLVPRDEGTRSRGRRPTRLREEVTSASKTGRRLPQPRRSPTPTPCTFVSWDEPASWGNCFAPLASIVLFLFPRMRARSQNRRITGEKRAHDKILSWKRTLRRELYDCKRLVKNEADPCKDAFDDRTSCNTGCRGSRNPSIIATSADGY
ncbi:hypothetical protein AKJ16_DCAP13038 [Drosera capensis]